MSYFVVRPSHIQGLGAFASRHIRKGTRVTEYIGERISQEEANQRYDDTATASPYVLLFTVDKHTVIDAGVDGNDARFINHSCDPNCEAIIEDGHVYIEAVKGISVGEELTYDYNLTWDDQGDTVPDKRYSCQCGAETCRGTMLKPRRKAKRPRKRNPHHVT